MWPTSRFYTAGGQLAVALCVLAQCSQPVLSYVFDSPKDSLTDSDQPPLVWSMDFSQEKGVISSKQMILMEEKLPIFEHLPESLVKEDPDNPVSKDEFVHNILESLRYRKTLSVNVYPSSPENKHIGFCRYEFNLPFNSYLDSRFPHAAASVGPMNVLCFTPSQKSWTSEEVAVKGSYTATSVFVDVDGEKKTDGVVTTVVKGEIKIDKDNKTGCRQYDPNKYQYQIFSEFFDTNSSKEYTTYREDILGIDQKELKHYERSGFINEAIGLPASCLYKFDKDTPGSVELLKTSMKLLDPPLEACKNNCEKDIQPKGILTYKEKKALKSYSLFMFVSDSMFVGVRPCSTLGKSKGECLLEKIQYYDDLSANHRMGHNHNLRLEYFKNFATDESVPGLLYALSITIYGSVEVSIGVPVKSDDHLNSPEQARISTYGSAPHAVSVHKIISSYHPTEGCNPPSPPSIYPMLNVVNGYKYICGPGMKGTKGPYNVEEIAKKLYILVYEDTGIDELVKENGYHFDNQGKGSRPALVQDPEIIKKNRMKFLTMAVEDVKCVAG